ncbi:MAG: PAS domain-containing protein, partial [Sulfurospirillaceae bacterium]|nr:PAS domain-containing protein [Sulfurospirillaceae bacterium]
FSHLPIDITMVDEHGKVVFFNQSKDRIFSRTPSIIGREVKLCHPPKSLDKVLKILDAFKNGTKNEAQFWIKLEDKTIHIRYFALKDENGKYKGVLETTQDISKMGELKGEKRLLDWQEGSIA